MADESTSSARTNRSFWRRWLVRLPVVVVVFLVVLFVLAQALLWSNVPRRIAEREIGNALGAIARIDKLSIGWNGRTRLEGLSLQFPMADEPFARVRQVEIAHTALPLLVFEQNVESATVRGARVHLHEESAGRWNLQRLAESRAGRRDPADESAKRVPNLPDIILEDASVRVTRRNGRDATLEGISARFARTAGAAAIEKTIEARLGDHVTASGRMALVRDLPHEVRVRADRVPPAIEALFGPIRQPAAGLIEWRGRRTEDGIAGVLDVDGARYGDFSADGEVGLRTRPRLPAPGTAADAAQVELLVEPNGLTIRQLEETPATAPATAPSTAAATAPAAVTAVSAPAPATAPATQPAQREPPTLTLESGAIALAADRVRVDRVRGKLNGGAVAADGWLEPETLVADLTVAWQQVTQGGVASSGVAAFKTSRKLTGALSTQARVETSLRLAAGEASSSLEIVGEGTSPEAFVAELRTRPLRWQPAGGKPPMLVPALVGRLEAEGKFVRLLDLRPVEPAVGTIQASAAFERDKPLWWVAIDGRGLQLAQLGLSAAAAAGTARHDLATRPTDVNINVSGTFTRVDVKQLYLMQGNAAFWAAGFYDATLPEPLRLDTWASYTIPPIEGEVDQLKGLTAHGVVAGTLAPRHLAARGTVEANELVLRGRRFGDVAVEIEAQVTGEAGSLRSRELELLGGQWSVRGAWQAGEVPPQLVVAWRDLPAARVAELLKVQGVEGQITAGRATFVVPSTRLADATMEAEVRGQGLKYKTLAADELRVEATLDDGDFVARPVLFRQGGRIESEVSFRVRDPNPITATAKLDRWPAPPLAEEGELAGVESRLSGDVQLRFAPATREMLGETALTGTIARPTGETVGGVRLDARIVNDELSVGQLRIDALDGQVRAEGVFRLRDLQASRFDLAFERLAPAALAWLAPQLADAGGRYAGEFHLHPSPPSLSRPLGPVQARLSITSDGGNWRGVELKSIESVAFGEYLAPGDFRIVTQSARVDAAGGTIKPFFRLSNAPNQGLTQLLTAGFERIDIEPIVRAYDDDGKPVVGRVAGEVRVYGPIKAVETMAAEARVRLTESDLANFGPVAMLYDLMRVGTAGREPRGEGRLGLRLERGDLSLLYANYFNRGVYIDGFGTIADVEKMPHSPIDLTLVGSAQPLRDIKLPFFADADKIMEILQSTLTTIRAEGTLKDPKPRQAALDELGKTFEKILVGNRTPARE